jgi:hypothetical protein
MRLPSFVVAVALSALQLLPLCGAQSPARDIAAPGMVNYIEGQALASGQAVEPGMLVKAGQSLTTKATGKVELLLTPGAFLRVGENSRVTFNSASPAATELQLERGRAIVEVDQIEPQTKLRMNLNGAVVRIEAPGLYDFDAVQNQVRVFDGTADVAAYGMRITLTGGHWLDLNSEDLLVAARFDGAPDWQDDLYDWSSLRSAYLAEASISAAESAPVVAQGQGDGEWSWNPSYEAYTYVPDAGIAYSPFGWGFYSPILVYRAPITVAPGPIHRFHIDPGKGGPGHHYAVTRPQPQDPPPPESRHALTAGFRFEPALASSTGLQAGATYATPNAAASHPAPRYAEPIQSFHAAPSFQASAPHASAPAPHMTPQPAPSAPRASSGSSRH